MSIRTVYISCWDTRWTWALRVLSVSFMDTLTCLEMLEVSMEHSSGEQHYWFSLCNFSLWIDSWCKNCTSTNRMARIKRLKILKEMDWLMPSLNQRLTPQMIRAKRNRSSSLGVDTSKCWFWKIYPRHVLRNGCRIQDWQSRRRLISRLVRDWNKRQMSSTWLETSDGSKSAQITWWTVTRVKHSGMKPRQRNLMRRLSWAIMGTLMTTLMLMWWKAMDWTTQMTLRWSFSKSTTRLRMSHTKMPL